jgi:predicted enzyme related to lactoylglutathione lyase
MEAHDVTKAGEFCWNELMTSDYVAGFDFYKNMFGWEKKDEFDMGPMGKYWLFGQGDKTYGGMMTKPADAKMPPAWIYYVEVADLDAAIERAKSKGGKVVNGPMDVPGGTRIAQLFDPQGALFALHSAGKK